MSEKKRNKAEEKEKEKIQQSEQKSPDDFNGQDEDIVEETGDKEHRSPDDFEQEPEEEDEEPESKKTGKGKKKKKEKESEAEKINKLEQQVGELNDKYLRLYSEFDNYRKRSIKERIEYTQSAARDLIVELLPVLDDFERALNSFDEEKNSNNNEMREGVQLIYNKLKSLLMTKGLSEIDAKEKEFDTDFHEAVTQIPAPSGELKGKVVDVVEKGYMLNDKVIRYAKVVVGK